MLLSRIDNNKLSFCTIMCRNQTTSCNASHCSMQAPYSKLIFALRVCNSLYAVRLSLEGIQLFTTNVTPKIIQGRRTLLPFSRISIHVLHFINPKSRQLLLIGCGRVKYVPPILFLEHVRTENPEDAEIRNHSPVL